MLRLIAFAATLAQFVLAGSFATATPRLTISNPLADFGVVPMNSSVTYRYWLHSTGSSDLIIEWTDASCPCARFPLADSAIAPGDSAAFELIVYSGRTAGSLSNKPRVKSNAEKQPVRVDFTATVVTAAREARPIGIYPFRADLSAFGAYRQDTAVIEILNHHNLPMTMEALYGREEFFNVVLPGEIAPGETGSCQVILSPQAPEAAFEKSFTIEGTFKRVGDVSERARITVPVRRKYGGQATTGGGR